MRANSQRLRHLRNLPVKRDNRATGKQAPKQHLYNVAGRTHRHTHLLSQLHAVYQPSGAYTIMRTSSLSDRGCRTPPREEHGHGQRDTSSEQQRLSRRDDLTLRDPQPQTRDTFTRHYRVTNDPAPPHGPQSQLDHSHAYIQGQYRQTSGFMAHPSHDTHPGGLQVIAVPVRISLPPSTAARLTDCPERSIIRDTFWSQ